MRTHNSRLTTAEPARSTKASAFALVETMMAMAVVGILFTALYTGISFGWGVTQLSRENLRATQIMQDRTEELRLYNWSEISSFGATNSYIPTNFTVPFYPSTTNYATSDVTVGGAPTNSSGLLYYGTLSVTSNLFPACAYSNDLIQFTVTLKWTNTAPRQRTLSTLICQYGMHDYVY